MKSLQRLLSPIIAFGLLIAMTGQALAFTHVAPCEPYWPELPIDYHINNQGTFRISDQGAVENALHAAFEAWEEPCCSDFRANYAGNTFQTALTAEEPVVLSFSDSEWPAGFGGPDTLGLAFLTWNANCQLESSPIIFNTFHNAFDLTGEEVDLQSVATHEVGHLLGLGHSRSVEATMYAIYVGGTGQRTIQSPDVAGVCTIYPRDCSCTGDEDCRLGETCVNQNCIVVPCQDDGECTDGRICLAGDCVLPPCSNDTDCDDGLVCENDRCLNACGACRVCETHDDCGSYGYCHPFAQGPRCMVICGTDDRCPGDSQCLTITEGNEEFFFCVSPDAEGDNYCPPGYTCQVDDAEEGPCAGLGDDCGGGCPEASDTCLAREDGSNICTCNCITDADCGSDSLCIAVEEGRVCIPERTNPCANVECRSFERCYDGRCVDPHPAVERESTRSSCAAAAGSSPGSGALMAFLMLLGVLVRRRASSASRPTRGV